MDSVTSKVFGGEPIALTDGQAVILDCRGRSYVTVISAGTITVTRVNTRPPTTAGPGADNAVLPAASSSSISATTAVAFPVDWPFIRVKVAGNTGLVYAGAGSYVPPAA